MPHRLFASSLAKSCTICLNIAIIFFVVTTSNAAITDQCDWRVSGGNPSLVHPLHARCSQGSIQWSYPRGALYLVLRLGSGNKDFKGCLKVSPDYQGVRIYLQGVRGLHPLLTASDGEDSQLPRCFFSSQGRVKLYVEADSGLVGTMIAKFKYSLKAVSKAELSDPNEECRPCTPDELLHAYCTSDFVIQGKIFQVEHKEALQRTEVTVDVSRVHYDRRWTTSSDSTSFEVGKNSVVHVPSKCGVQTGSGEFVFFGSTFLSSPSVRCAPRFEDWWRIRTRALRLGANQCDL